MSAQGYQQVEHTADLALSIWAPDYGALLEQGACALVDIMTEGALIDGQLEREVAIEAMDREDLLVQWLNEVIFLAVTERFTVARAELQLDGARLTGRLFGAEGAELKGELKSATYHGLELTEQDGAARAFVVIDV